MDITVGMGTGIIGWPDAGTVPHIAVLVGRGIDG